jgi:ribonucleoside-diphosphate reductase alpha chain
VSERQARLGLGVMGFADLLRKAGVRYDSAEAVAWAEHIGAAMRAAADEYRQENPSGNPNRRLLTLAPTGGTSLITNASFSIEPFFHHAHSISPEQHVRVQSAWQRHVDNGVSKTVNLPFEATKEDVAYIYDLAHALDCKGVTVYRDGCRSAQPIATKRQ